MSTVKTKKIKKKFKIFFLVRLCFLPYNLLMNWLIVSDDLETTNLAKDFINKKFKESIVYTFTSEVDVLKESFGILQQITHAVFIANHDNPVVTFVAGCLCGRNVSVYVAGKTLEHFLREFDCFNFFDDSESLLGYLKKNAKKIIDEDIKVSAYSYLFENGIPFDSDNFAAHIVKKEKDEEKTAVNRQILECYLAAGIDINSRDSDGTPMLNIACRSDNLEAVKWLVELGADINAVSEDRGYTALMDAVWRGNKEITEYLISQKAELNTISKEGQTNLVLAVGADKTEIVQLLAENGADPDIADAMGMSAYGYAQLFKKDNILAILEKYHKE